MLAKQRCCYILVLVVLFEYKFVFVHLLFVIILCANEVGTLFLIWKFSITLKIYDNRHDYIPYWWYSSLFFWGGGRWSSFARSWCECFLTTRSLGPCGDGLDIIEHNIGYCSNKNLITFAKFLHNIDIWLWCLKGLIGCLK